MNRSMKVISAVCLVVLLTGVVAGCAPTQQDKYPSRPIAFVLGFGVGGGADGTARGIQPYLNKYLGVNINVDNRVGAGAAVARNFVYEQPADGYVVYQGMSSDILFSEVYKDSQTFKEDFLEAFVPVASYLTNDGNAIIVPNDSAIKTIPDLIAEAKKRTLNFGLAGGFGSSDHMGALIMKKTFGIDFTFIPFNSGAELAAAIRGNKVDVASLGVLNEAADPTAMRFLATMTKGRADRSPNSPSFEELGYPQLVIPVHIGTFVKKGTPENIISILEDAQKKSFDDPGFQKWAKDVQKPIGQFKDRKAWTDFLIALKKQVQGILPDLKADMEKTQQGK